MKKNQKGFTLVELMIVVAIIGILAAVAIPKFADMLEKSREGATKGNLSSLNSGISLYVSDNQGVAPGTLDTSTYTTGGATYPAFVTQYMDNVPSVKATAKKKSALAAWNNWTSPASAVITYNTAGLGSASVANGLITEANKVLGGGGGGWLYNPMGSAGSNFWVNSFAGDMKSNASTPMMFQYTMYGYE